MRKLLILLFILALPFFAVTAQDSIAVGDTVQGKAANANVEYTFEATSGAVVIISLQSTEFDPKIEVYNDNGELLGEDDDSGGSLNALLNFTAPADGTYTLRVTNFIGAANGAFTLSLTGLEATAIEIGGTTSVQFNGTDNQFFNFEGVKDQVVTIFVDSADQFLDTELTLTGPNGEEVANDDDSGAGTDPALLRIVLPEDGNYTLQLGPSYGQELVGVVNLFIEESEQQLIGSDPVALTLGGGNFESDVLRFEAEANTTYRLTVRSTNGLNTSVRVDVSPDDFTQPRISFDGVIGGSFDFRANADGLIDIQVSMGFLVDSTEIEITLTPVE
ncbi:MAG: hypothetical protein OHK0046_01100 [Anaerolineae bacterium]